MSGDDIEIRGCTFLGNRADCGALDPRNCIVGGLPLVSAGALFVVGSPDFILTGCTFDDNSSFDAGAFTAWAGPGGVPLLVKGNTFSRNRAARNGGAVAFDHGRWGIRNCAFEANSADSAGGAVFVLDNTGFLKDCTFLGDRVTGKGATNYFNGGGAVGLRATTYCSAADSFSIERCRFDACSSAADGGSIYTDQAFKFIIRDTAIRASHAEGDGGGMYVANRWLFAPCPPDTVFIESTRFQDCTAAGRGGALFIAEGKALLDNVLLSGCSAEDGGAVYYNKADTLAPLTWSNLTFAGNSGEGAALFLNNHNHLAVTRSIFYSNDAGAEGSIVTVGNPDSVNATFLCCDSFANVPANAPLPCDSCFTADPLFCDMPIDASVLLASPCNEGNHPFGKQCGIIGIRSLCEFPIWEHTWLDEGHPVTNYSGSDTLRVGAAGDTAIGLVAVHDVRVFPGAKVDSAMITADVERVGGSGSDTVTVHACLRDKARTDQATWYVYRLGSAWGRAGAGEPDGDYGSDVLGVGSGFQAWATDTLGVSTELGRWIEDDVLGMPPIGRGMLVFRPGGTKEAVFYNLLLRIWTSFP